MLGTETPLLILFIAISSSLLHFHSPPWCDRMAVNFDNSWSMTSVELELLVQEPCFCSLSSCSPLSWTPPSFFPDTSHFAVAKGSWRNQKAGHVPDIMIWNVVLSTTSISIFLRKPSFYNAIHAVQYVVRARSVPSFNFKTMIGHWGPLIEVWSLESW